MIALEYILAILIFWIIPLWLVGRAWRRFRSTNYSIRDQLLLSRTALILLSASLGILVLMTGLTNSGRYGQSLIRYCDPMMVSICNLPLTLGALLISLRLRQTDKEPIRIKGAIVAASTYLIVAWLLLLGH